MIMMDTLSYTHPNYRLHIMAITLLNTLRQLYLHIIEILEYFFITRNE